MIGLLLIVIMAFIGPLMNKHDFAEQNVDHRNLPAKIPLLDHVSFLPFDGKGTDGKNAYKEAGAKENYWFGTDQLDVIYGHVLERCSNFTLYWCSCCIIRYLYWRCIWSRFWFLWRQGR